MPDVAGRHGGDRTGDGREEALKDAAVKLECSPALFFHVLCVDELGKDVLRLVLLTDGGVHAGHDFADGHAVAEHGNEANFEI